MKETVANRVIAGLKTFSAALRRGDRNFRGHVLHRCDRCGEIKRAGELCKYNITKTDSP